MEQLAIVSQVQLRMDKNIHIAKVLKKVELKLSGMQLESLVKLMKFYFQHAPMETLMDQVICFNLYQVYEKKLRRCELSFKSNFKIKLDIAQAATLFAMLGTLKTPDSSYEYALIDYLTSEIDHQTC